MKLTEQKMRFFRNKAVDIRKRIVEMMASADASHSGSSLSTIEILVALYFGIMHIDPKHPWMRTRDRFILSKGHGGAALYATLAERGYFPHARLKTFCVNGGKIPTHPVYRAVPGVEATTGSLGHGLSIGVGMAMNAKYEKEKHNIFVMLSDGECDEGSVWEAVLAAGFRKLDNLVVLVDYNKIQSFGRTKEVLDLEPFADKWRSFGWAVREINGHDFTNIDRVFSKIPAVRGKPTCIIAHTIKGKNVSYMEDRLEWHYHAPKGKYLGQALRELDIQCEP